MRRGLVTTLLTAVLVLGLAGPAFAPPLVNTISGNAYDPLVWKVTANYYLSWKNDDAVPHTATADGPFKVFDTGDITPGGGYSAYVYPAGPSKFPYHCKHHAGMTGTLDLRPSVTGTLTPGSDVTIAFAYGGAPPKGMKRQVQLRSGGGDWETIYQGRDNHKIILQFDTVDDYQVRGRMSIRRTGEHTRWSSRTGFVIN